MGIGFISVVLVKMVIFLILIFVLTHENNDSNENGNSEVDQYFIISRPTIYSGLQTTTPTPIYFGMIYNDQDEERGGFVRLREQVDYHDRLNYRVIRTDPTRFCHLEMYDDLHSEIKLDIKWTKPKNDSFLYRINGDFFHSQKCQNDIFDGEEYLSVYLYIGLTEGRITKVNSTMIEGYSENYGYFRLSFIESANSPRESHFLSTYNEKPFFASDLIFDMILHGVSDYGPACCHPLNHERNLPDKQDWFGEIKSGNEVTETERGSNFAVIQSTVKVPFSINVKFERISDPLNGYDSDDAESEFDSLFAQQVAEFEDRFDQVFSASDSLLRMSYNLQDGIRPSDWREFGLRVLSGLLNGFSYFQGKAFIKNPESGETWSVVRELYTLIPGKIGFPRGFYWDEAFHQMIVLRFSSELHEKITVSWYDLMDESTGWIAREQIIGEEAMASSPEWAWPGLTNQMNAPAFFCATEQYWMSKEGKSEEEKGKILDFFKNMFPKFEKVLNWYLTNCEREVENTFGWNGRKSSGDSSFDSGLDDFPRILKFSETEKNVDLQSWIVKVSSLMEEWSEVMNDPSKTEYYRKLTKKIKSKLNSLFWNEELQFYVDINNEIGKYHEIGTPGYLPLCLKIEDDHDRILKLLRKLNDSSELFTEYGIMSLSKKSEHFKRSGNYWRGNIWINMNYLCLQAMEYYEKLGYVEMKEARERLEYGIAKNMYKNYFERGVMRGNVYETFHPLTGRGYNHVPFVGWSGLVVLIMSENY